jgi:CBS domain-containing protein
MLGHARSFMTHDVVTAAPSEPLSALATSLLEREASSLVVIDDERRVLGLVTEGDLAAALLRGDDPEATRAAALMSREVHGVDEFDTADEVLTVLRDKGIHQVPVLREGRLVGLVRTRDVLRFWARTSLAPPPALA